MRLFACERGNAAVEFSLVAPLFISLLLGVVEFGRYHWIQNGLRFAVEEAGRFAIANSSASAETIAAKVLAKAPSTGTAPVIDVQASSSGGMNFITIQASTDFSFLMPFLPIGPLPIASRTTVPVGS
ncbi:MAG: pilus assembly protein [Alphaproteobacteria bacterium]|nr:pilus assembly protein [Alphaproteobacteria bacterium]